MDNREILKEIFILPDTNEKNQFYITPHAEYIVVNFSGVDNNFNISSKTDVESNFTIDKPRIQSFQELISHCGNLYLNNLEFFYDNRGNLNILVNLTEKTDLSDIYHIYHSYSNDYGKNWEDPVKLNSDFDSWILRDHPIILKSGIQVGNILVPIECANSGRSLVLHSDIHAKEWNISLYIEPPEYLIENEDDDNNFLLKTSDPSIFETSDGKIICIYRITNPDKYYYAISRDRGYTWNSIDKIDFEFDPKYLIKSIKCGFHPEHIPQKTYFLGMCKINNKFLMRLSVFDDLFKDGKSIWESESFSTVDPQWYTLYCDIDQNLHILYILASNISKLYHVQFNSLDLDF